MPDFEGQNFKKEKVHTTDMLQGKITLMTFVLAQYAEVRNDFKFVVRSST
jgi:ATPase complex subunit ATP10